MADSKLSTAVEKPLVLVAVDDEGTGSRMSVNGMVAIGWYIGHITGEKIDKGRISLALGPRQFELRCVEQYWAAKDKDGKQPQMEQLKVFQKEAVDPKVGMQKFIDMIDKLEDKFELAFISDNPAYDFGFINHYLDVYLNRGPLSVKKDQTSYRPLYDIASFALEYTVKKANGASLVFDTRKYIAHMTRIDAENHDHWPENDAEGIYRQTLATCACYSPVVKSADARAA